MRRAFGLQSVRPLLRALMTRPLSVLVFILAATTASAGQGRPELRWAGDAEGGAPFVEADPSNPAAVVGFDVEIADLIGRALGRTPRFVLIQFSSIDQSIERGDAEIGLSGIEDTPARRSLRPSRITSFARS